MSFPASRFLRAASAAAVLALAATGASAQQKFVNVLTGGQAGVYYPMGVALGQIYSKALPDYKTSVQATKASVENLNLLQAGRGEIAFTLGDSLSDAWKGVEDAGFKQPLERLRTIAGIYPNYIQIVASADSGIRTIADLKGKRVSVGAPRSGTELNARAIFKAAGISYQDFARVEYLPFGESVELMKNRQLDATLQSAGLGVASLRDLANSVAITVVEVPADLVESIGSPYQAAVIPADTYQGQTADVATASVINYLVTRADLDEETVYQMTKGVFEGLDDLAAAHAAARSIKLDESAIQSPVPLHPGAERYFREQGVM
jgi:uncharacterized protein